MDNNDKIIEGLEKAYKKLIEFKKYKKTPIIVSKDGKVVEINPDQITTQNNVYKK
jgi:hypothetical protein